MPKINQSPGAPSLPHAPVPRDAEGYRESYRPQYVFGNFM